MKNYYNYNNKIQMDLTFKYELFIQHIVDGVLITRKIEDTPFYFIEDIGFLLNVTISFSTFLHKIEIPFKFNHPSGFNYNDYLNIFSMSMFEKIISEIESVTINDYNYEINTLLNDFNNLQISDKLSMSNRNNELLFTSNSSSVSINRSSKEYTFFMNNLINSINLAGVLHYQNILFKEFQLVNNNNKYRTYTEQINKETGRYGII